MQSHSNRDRGIGPRLRQLGEEEVVLPIGGGLSISWLNLQVVLFFIACLICACCSISSYMWSSVSPHLTVPAPALAPGPARTVPHTPVGDDAETEGGAFAPTSTPTKPSAPVSTPHPTQKGTLIPPARTPTPGAVLQSPISTPPSAPEPATPSVPPPTRTRLPSPTPTSRPRLSDGSSDLHIVHVEYNPLGLDAGEKEISDLENEYIVVENRGTGDQDMTGWTLNNNELNTYWFPAGFLLRGGTSVRVWTRSGTDTEIELYWGSEEEVWNNDDGVAFLRDHTGTLIDSLDW